MKLYCVCTEDRYGDRCIVDICLSEDEANRAKEIYLTNWKSVTVANPYNYSVIEIDTEDSHQNSEGIEVIYDMYDNFGDSLDLMED